MKELNLNGYYEMTLEIEELDKKYGYNDSDFDIDNLDIIYTDRYKEYSKEYREIQNRYSRLFNEINKEYFDELSSITRNRDISCKCCKNHEYKFTRMSKGGYSVCKLGYTPRKNGFCKFKEELCLEQS